MERYEVRVFSTRGEKNYLKADFWLKYDGS